MRNDKPFTMIAPSAGFTSRVMTRIAEHERAQARRRALIGSVLLVIVAIAILVLVAWSLFVWVSAFITTPSAVISVFNAFSTLTFWIRTFIEMLWTVATIIIENVGVAQMLVLAIGVFALSIVWVRVVVGPFQLSSQLNYVGGLRK